jgi:CheY-like chemotaxis protein
MARSALEEGEPYALLILDMEMPDRSGLDVVRALRADQRLAATRILILSSGSELPGGRFGLTWIFPLASPNRSIARA